MNIRAWIDDCQCVHISVVDSGIGIDPSDQERVFGKFEQIDSSYARNQEGTGLGLALTKELVALHKGRIWVESEGYSKGSTFTFTIPFEIQEEKTVVDMEALSARGKKATVLVVEDDSNARELLSEYLTEAGYRVVLAVTGEEVIEKAKELKPFAITLDILLPGMDGFEVLKKLKDLPETRDIPVIVVSIVDEKQKGLALGATQYFVKPIEKQIFLDTLEGLISK